MKTGISLFSGAVDGLAIAFELAGIHVTHHVEYDAFCCANLRRLHPNTTVIEGDIRQLKELPYADVIFGGPPCQGFSGAGSRNGFADERYLWPEMFRLVEQVRPRCVLVENVRGAASGDNLIDAVLSDLESIGYTGGAFLIPACLFGAPHERNRLFIVAYAQRFGHEGQSAVANASPDEKRNIAAYQQSRNTKPDANLASGQALGNARRFSMAGQRPIREQKSSARHRKTLSQRASRYRRQSSPDKSRISGAAHGIAYWLVRLKFPGFPAGQGVYQHPFEPTRTIAKKGPHHKERIQALGNAVVWQQVHPFALAIKEWLDAN